VRDLEDPANPYRGQYAEWDYYCFAKAHSMTKAESKAWNRKQVPLTRRWIRIDVDANGYPVPWLESTKQCLEWYRDWAPTSEDGCTLTYSVYGDVPEALDERMVEAEQAVRAAMVPAIPRWLAVNPPLKALRLPDGSYIAYGALGSGRKYDLNANFLRPAPEVCCFHYSPEGKLLAQTDLDQAWYELFWPEAEQVLSGYDPKATYYWEDNGFIIVQQIEGWKQLAIYNYDGAPLPVETNVMSRDTNIWGGWFGREIMQMYAIQQHKHTNVQ
jgi:hypothetical protein